MRSVWALKSAYAAASGRISYLVEVDVHALELEVGSTVVPVACQMLFPHVVVSDVNVHSRGVEAMLAGDGLPEGSTDLVTLCGCQLHALHFAFIRTRVARRTHWPVWR